MRSDAILPSWDGRHDRLYDALSIPELSFATTIQGLPLMLQIPRGKTATPERTGEKIACSHLLNFTKS